MKSGEFKGATNFCLSQNNIDTITNILSNMYNMLEGVCEIEDNDSDSVLSLCINNKLGHLVVHGQIGGSHETHNMKFEFLTDQTVLESLKRYLIFINLKVQRTSIKYWV